MADPRSITVSENKLWPMTVKHASTNLGVTVGGVKVRIETTTVEQRVDQYDGPINTWRTGMNVEVTLTLAQSSYAKLALILWGGTTRSSGGTAYGLGGKVPGANDAQTDGVTLNLHRADTNSETLTDDINLYKAVVTNVGEATFGKDGALQWEVTYKGHIDTSKVAGGNAILDQGLAAAT